MWDCRSIKLKINEVVGFDINNKELIAYLKYDKNNEVDAEDLTI